MNAQVFDQTVCALGEGPMWHPLRKELFWFDILEKRLLCRRGDTVDHWNFRDYASACGWIDETHLFVATATDLLALNVATDDRQVICPIEAENPLTRTNDGRTDPYGGFWIGTMGLNAEPEAGAIYRYYRGELRQMFPRLTIPNAICFSPDGNHAFFADSLKGKIWRVDLNSEGWPVGSPRIFFDGLTRGVIPDGAVIDAAGLLWNAQWGAGRVVALNRQGEIVQQVILPTPHVTCPAFGGDDLGTLFCTTATQGLNPSDLKERPLSGQTFDLGQMGPGQAEHQVVL